MLLRMRENECLGSVKYLWHDFSACLQCPCNGVFVGAKLDLSSLIVLDGDIY